MFEFLGEWTGDGESPPFLPSLFKFFHFVSKIPSITKGNFSQAICISMN